MSLLRVIWVWWWGEGSHLTENSYIEKCSWEVLSAITAVGGQVLPQIKGSEWNNNHIRHLGQLNKFMKYSLLHWGKKKFLINFHFSAALYIVALLKILSSFGAMNYFFMLLSQVLSWFCLLSALRYWYSSFLCLNYSFSSLLSGCFHSQSHNYNNVIFFSWSIFASLSLAVILILSSKSI